MYKRLFCLLILILLNVPAVVHALTNPTHFVDTQWNLMEAAGYDSIEVDITPEVEENTSIDGYYFANTVYFRNYTGSNFGGAYAGLQTNGYDGSQWIGKMALFSVWDVSNGVAESNGKGTPFGGEGTGYSVRIPYAWQVGTSYRLKIYIDQDAASGDRLWGASLTDLSNNTTTRIGRIYVPADRGKIYGPVTFHERYMGPTGSCGDVKKSQVAFANMTANSGSNKATSWSHYHTAATPECPGLAWIVDNKDGFQSGISTTKPGNEPVPTQAQVKDKPKAEPVKVPEPEKQPVVEIIAQPEPSVEEIEPSYTNPETPKLKTSTLYFYRSISPMLIIFLFSF